MLGHGLVITPHVRLWMYSLNNIRVLTFVKGSLVLWVARVSLDTMLMLYSDVIMGTIASQTTSLTIVYSTVYSGADQRTHQNSVSLASVRGIHRWPVNFPHKGPVTRKMFPFDNVVMENHGQLILYYNTFMPGFSEVNSMPKECNMNLCSLFTVCLNDRRIIDSLEPLLLTSKSQHG